MLRASQALRGGSNVTAGLNELTAALYALGDALHLLQALPNRSSLQPQARSAATCCTLNAFPDANPLTQPPYCAHNFAPSRSSFRPPSGSRWWSSQNSGSPLGDGLTVGQPLENETQDNSDSSDESTSDDDSSDEEHHSLSAMLSQGGPGLFVDQSTRAQAVTEEEKNAQILAQMMVATDAASGTETTFEETLSSVRALKPDDVKSMIAVRFDKDVEALASVLEAVSGTEIEPQDVAEVFIDGPGPVKLRMLLGELLSKFSDEAGNFDMDSFIEESKSPLLADEDVREAISRMSGKSSISEEELDTFIEALGTEVVDESDEGSSRKVLTQATLDAFEEIKNMLETEAPDFIAEIAPDRTDDSVEAKEAELKEVLSGLSDESKQRLAEVATSDRDLYYFLIRNFDQLRKDPETSFRQLLEVFMLHKKPVSRGFSRGQGNALPPQVAWSPMKPLNTEVSYRTNTGIVLFPPQRITLGAYVDFSKIVRPMRTKNILKRLKYMDIEDIYHRE